MNRVLAKKSPIYDIEHLQLFSPRSLEELLKPAGFTGVSVFPITNAYPLSYWMRLSLLPRAAKERLIGGLDRVGVGRVNVNIPVPVGNLGAIGVKPG